MYGTSSCRAILAYDFAQRGWTWNYIPSPQFHFGQAEVAFGNQIIFLDNKQCTIQVWEVGHQSRNARGWVGVETFLLWPKAPGRFSASVMIGDHLYLASNSKRGPFVQSLDYGMKLKFELWQLSTFSWERIWPSSQFNGGNETSVDVAFVSSATDLSRSLIALTGLTSLSHPNSTEISHVHVWGFNATDRSMVCYQATEETRESAPVARYLYAVASVNEFSLLLFGL